VIGIAALAAAIGCDALRPIMPLRSEPVDLSPLLEFESTFGSSIRLQSAFADYQPIVIGGVQLQNGSVRGDGIVDLVRETYDSELDEFHSWSVDVTVTLFDTGARAERDLDSTCHSFAHGGASGSPVRWQDGVYCATPVVRRPTDPQNQYQPSSLYSSWVFVRRDRIVLRLYERHEGSPKSAKNAIIQDLAARLEKLSSLASE
jgi:hypothetical protein